MYDGSVWARRRIFTAEMVGFWRAFILLHFDARLSCCILTRVYLAAFWHAFILLHFGARLSCCIFMRVCLAAFWRAFVLLHFDARLSCCILTRVYLAAFWRAFILQHFDARLSCCIFIIFTSRSCMGKTFLFTFLISKENTINFCSLLSESLKCLRWY